MILSFIFCPIYLSVAAFDGKIHPSLIVCELFDCSGQVFLMQRLELLWMIALLSLFRGMTTSGVTGNYLLDILFQSWCCTEVSSEWLFENCLLAMMPAELVHCFSLSWDLSKLTDWYLLLMLLLWCGLCSTRVVDLIVHVAKCSKWDGKTSEYEWSVCLLCPA